MLRVGRIRPRHDTPGQLEMNPRMERAPAR